MIRVHFSEADLARVTFGTEPDPLWDAALGARALGDRPIPQAARRWRRQAAVNLRPSMRPLFKLIAPTGQFPGFLTPELAEPGLEPAVAQLIETPADIIRGQLEPWLPSEIEPWMTDFLAGRTRARRSLGDAVRAFHNEVLALSAIESEQRFAADLAIRSRALLSTGVEGMLAGLHPDVRWRAPVLEAQGLVGDGSTREVHLGGRGLLLYPSALTAECLLLDPPGRRPVMVYPSADLPYDDLCGDSDQLAELIGRTRAAVLRTLRTSASTTQLARRTGISLASASEHARILRNAGLVTTHRAGGIALHSLTPSAHRLLASPRPHAPLRPTSS